MNVTAASLRQIHRIQRQLTDLNDRLTRGPQQVAAGQTCCSELEQKCAQAKEALTRSKIACDEKQLQLRQREAKIEDLKSKLNSCGSNREYQALNDQIAADLQANSVLEDEILEALEQIEQQDTDLKQAASQWQESVQQVERLQQKVAGERAQLESELERVRAELKQVEDDLPAEFRAEYQRISAARGEHALAAVEDEICTSCYQRLTAQTMNELLLERPVFCKTCGSVLYLPEDSRVG